MAPAWRLEAKIEQSRFGNARSKICASAKTSTEAQDSIAAIQFGNVKMEYEIDLDPLP